MASDKGFLDFVLEQLSDIGGITCRKMMGEYIIYLNGKIAAYIRDNRLLVKPTKSALYYVTPHSRRRPLPSAFFLLTINIRCLSELTYGAV